MDPQLRHTLSADVESDELAVRRLYEDMGDAVRRQDLHAILAPYAENAVIYDVRDALQIDKEGLRANWQQCFDGADQFGIEFGDITVNVSGNLAVAYALIHAMGKTNDGEKIDIWMRNSTALRKTLGKWQIIHDHISAPGKFETGRIMQDLKPPHEMKH